MPNALCRTFGTWDFFQDFFVLFMLKLFRLLYLQRLWRILIHLLALAALYLPLKTVTPTSGAQPPTK